jgi:hypothetical protein
MKIKFPLIFFTAVIFISGCAVFSPKPFSPIQTEYPSGLDPSDIYQLLEERHQMHSNLWARGKITLSGEPIEGKKFFHATLLYQEPDRLRLRGSRMITSTLFEFIINAENMAILFNKDKMWFEGMRSDLHEHPDASLRIDPVILPRALQIHQEFLRLFVENRFDKWRKGGNDYLFLGTGDDDLRVAFILRKRDLLIREAGIYNEDGELALRIHYKRYAVFDHEILPEELEVYIPDTGITTSVKIKEYKHPPVFQEAIFLLKPPQGFRRYPLSDLIEIHQR